MIFKLVSIKQHLTMTPNKFGYRLHFVPFDPPNDLSVTLHPGAEGQGSFRDGFVISSYNEPYAKSFELGRMYDLSLSLMAYDALEPTEPMSEEESTS